MRLPSPRPLSPAIPVAALANIALLLAFFLPLPSIPGSSDDDTVLPRAPGLHEAARDAACLTVLRRVSAASGEALSFRLSGGPGEARELMGREDLYLEASRIADGDPERTFLLRIDASVRYAVVDDILETLRNAGVRNVVLGSRPDDSEGA